MAKEKKINKILTGMKFGRLKVLYSGKGSKMSNRTGYFWVPTWVCSCTCGNFIEVNHYKLLSGHSKSCGCGRKIACGNNFRTHGKSGSIEHRSWKAMIGRCYNKNNEKYPNYGARGIKVSDEWRNSFEVFLNDMGPRPKGQSLGRIDNDGDYCKENCRWENDFQQANNKTTNLVFVYNGVEMTLAQIARVSGLKYGTLLYRVSAGYDLEEAINKPLRKNKHKQTNNRKR